MTDTHLDALDAAGEDADLEGGGVYLLKWITETWGEAAKGVLSQVGLTIARGMGDTLRMVVDALALPVS